MRIWFPTSGDRVKVEEPENQLSESLDEPQSTTGVGQFGQTWNEDSPGIVARREEVAVPRSTRVDGERSGRQQNKTRNEDCSENRLYLSDRKRSANVEKSFTKRSRVHRNGGAVKSFAGPVPAARTMTAPKGECEDDRRDDHSPKDINAHLSWEENEPAPLRNHNNYKNPSSHQKKHKIHPANISRLTLSHDDVTTLSQEEEHDGPVDDEEMDFKIALKRIGLEIMEQEGDGNCLFRAVSLQVYGDSSMHAEIREQCLNFMALNEEHFGQFMSGEPFQSYIARKRMDGVHGNNPEIQAISELFNRPVEVFTPLTGAKPLNIFHKEYSTSDAPIRLSYHDGNHYNAVVDPSNPTAGLGLGLPGLRPGLADKLQVAAATAESDVQNDLEQAIKESQEDHKKYDDDQLKRVLVESSYSIKSMYKDKAYSLSDTDATNFELEQAVLETSLQTFKSEVGARKQLANKSNRAGKQHALQLASQFHDVHTAAARNNPGAPAALPQYSTILQDDLSDSPYDYPSVVQELVMNGFELGTVVQAYGLIGENFDDLLSFLMSNN